LAAFFEKIKLREVFEEAIPVKERSPNRISIYSKILSYTFMIYAGGSRFSHLLYLRCYEMEKLRCNLCGEVFTAKPPNNVGTDKYDETAGAMIAMLKYGSGVPFYRIEASGNNNGRRRFV